MRSSVCTLSKAMASKAMAICVGLTITTCQADDWPQWRGPHRDGKSAEKGLLASWPEGGPKLLWQTNNLGAGFSTPSGADGSLYLICNEGMDNEYVVALSIEDGSKRWSTKIGKVGKNEGPDYPGSRSTPSIDGDSVYALGSDGDLACLDTKTGSIKWAMNLRTQFDGKPGSWAYTESPLVDGDALIVSPGGSTATVVALNKEDGSVIWKAPLEEADDASYSSPVKANINGRRQYVMFLAKGVAGIDAATGELLWRYTGTADKDANVQTPVVMNNLVYSAAGRVGGALIRIEEDQAKPEEIYFGKTLPTGMGGSILVDGNLFGASGPTQICVDFATGEKKWQERSVGAGSLCYADGKLYIHGDNNDVAMVEATRKDYKELGRFTPPNAPDRAPSKAWTYPIIVDGKLIIRDVGTVWCYDIRG